MGDHRNEDEKRVRSPTALPEAEHRGKVWEPSQGSQDEIDTAKVVIRENTRVEFQSVVVEPRVRTQLEIAPQLPMEKPVLFMSLEPSSADVEVEQIAVGHFVVIVSPGKAKDYQFGRPIEETVTARETLRILLRCEDSRSVKVGASLVTNEKPGTYRINKG